MNFALPDTDDPIHGFLQEAKNKWHQRLLDAKVKISILFASDPGGGPAIKRNGYPVTGLIKPLSSQWRALIQADALLLVDESDWREMEEETKLAFMDHELSHLDIVDEEDAFGRIVAKRDDAGRPRLRSVPGDWNGGDGFRMVVARHGAAAIEFDNARRVHRIATAARQAHDQLDEEPDEPDEAFTEGLDPDLFTEPNQEAA